MSPLGLSSVCGSESPAAWNFRPGEVSSEHYPTASPRVLLRRRVVELELCSSVKAGLNSTVLPQPSDDLHQLRRHGPLFGGVSQVVELSPGILCNPEVWLRMSWEGGGQWLSRGLVGTF